MGPDRALRPAACGESSKSFVSTTRLRYTPPELTVAEVAMPPLRSALIATLLAASTPAWAGPPLPEEYLLPDGRVLPVLDLRDWAASESVDLALLDPEAFAQQECQFAAARVARVRERGLIPEEVPLLRALGERAGVLREDGAFMDDPPVPGGVGHGTLFDDDAFFWSIATVAHQKMIAPRKPGGDVTTWLYNTSTNRSNLGVEAFLSYYGQTDFEFKVFDWARAALDPWQVALPYVSLGDYLYTGMGGDGVWRQEVYVINETSATGVNSWVNRVYLEDKAAGTLDLVYEYSYVTAELTENLWQSGDSLGWWGPIFETFQDHDGSNSPMGINDFWLVQDGAMLEVDGTNSSIRIDDADMAPPLFLVANGAWAVGSSTGEPAITNVEGEAGIHVVGEMNGDGWRAGPEHGPGNLFVTNAFSTLPPSRLAVDFELKVDSLAGPALPLARLRIQDLTTGTYVMNRVVQLAQFAVPGSYRPFRMEFTPAAGHAYRFSVFSLGQVDLTLDRVAVVKI